jgi:phage baseplate assembly protein W
MADALDYGTDLLVSAPLRASSAIDLVPAIEADDTGALLRDLATVTARDNLAQAIRLHLATARGELAHLGHPNYGSRLHHLIGRLDSDTTRALARAYVREALRDEPRISRISHLDVYARAEQPGDLLIDLHVLPIDDSDVLALQLRLALDGTEEP